MKRTLNTTINRSKIEKDGAHNFPFYDHIGNVVAVINESGAIVAAYEYDPFGNIVAQSGAEADEVPFRFSTKYWDAEAGLYYYGYRFYSPELGRWINRDPIEEEGWLAFPPASRVSMFFHYFAYNFEALGLKRLITTCYKS